MPCSPKNDPLFACLVLERGAPYEKGACFLLRQSKLTLEGARARALFDITFDSLLISRKHCCIEQRGEGWSICELKSKHGTLLNGEPLPQSLSVPLKHGDKIGLAANIVSLRFSLTPELDQTLDYNCADPFTGRYQCRNRPSPWSSTPRKSPCWSAARKLRCRRRNGSCQNWCINTATS